MTYQEHLKRHLEEDEINEQNGVPKRPKLQSTSFSSVPVSYSHLSPNTSQKQLQQAIIQNSRHQATTQNVKQAIIQNSIQQIVNQNVRKVRIQNSKQYENSKNYTNKEFFQNSMQPLVAQNSLQKVDIQNSIQGNHSTMEQSYTSGQTVNKNYLPWTQSSVLTASNNILTPSNNRHQPSQTAIPNKMMNESTVMSHAMPYPSNVQIFHPIPVHQTTQMPLLHPAPVYLQMPKATPPNPYGNHKPKQMSWAGNTHIPPSNIHQLPKLQLAPTLQPTELNLQISDILQNTTSSHLEEHRKSGAWQHVSTVNVPDETTAVDLKQEPVTPVGKGLMSSSLFDSPGIDSRFTESLSNLLGSPLPESPLSKHPFLGDLQALLETECKREIVPQSLFGMQGAGKQNIETKNKSLNVFERERNLQERFTSLQSHHTEDVRQLSSMFRYQSALIETERFRTLHECQYPGSYKQSVNHHYDHQLHNVMDRVERSVQLLETSNKENRSSKPAIAKVRPHLSKESVRLMENWYQQNLIHPYPTNSVIEMLAQAGNIGIEQVKKWFANKRNRSANTRTLTEIAMQKRKLGQMPGTS